eukprot:599975-Pelagomonas_calceolata.AAC.1
MALAFIDACIQWHLHPSTPAFIGTCIQWHLHVKTPASNGTCSQWHLQSMAPAFNGTCSQRQLPAPPLPYRPTTRVGTPWYTHALPGCAGMPRCILHPFPPARQHSLTSVAHMPSIPVCAQPFLARKSWSPTLLSSAGVFAGSKGGVASAGAGLRAGGLQVCVRASARVCVHRGGRKCCMCMRAHVCHRITKRLNVGSILSHCCKSAQSVRLLLALHACGVEGRAIGRVLQN